MFAPVRLVVPAPTWFTTPVPEITLAIVTALERLNCRTALSVMLPATLPVVPPAPMLSVPAVIVVPPV